MTNILVTYTTNAGTTTNVARVVGEELTRQGLTVEVQRLEEVQELDPYGAVVIGAPMIFGWHRAAVSFIKKHETTLSRLPVAYFFTAMNLTQTDETSLEGIPFVVDPQVAKPPRNPARLSFKERYALPASYLSPVLKAAPRIRPVNVGFFGGELAMYRMKWWQMLFVLVFIQTNQGGSHNVPFIREWAAGIKTSIS